MLFQRAIRSTTSAPLRMMNMRTSPFAAGRRFYTQPAETIPNKVAVLGAAGGIGQPLSLLLKAMPEVEQLALYDIVNTPGVAADLSHICTPNKVTGHVGEEELGACLSGSEVVVIPAGVPRKPGMTRDDLFNINASIVHNLATACAKYCPNANILIISNPVNSTVPIMAETLKLHGVFNPKKIFGVTTLDVVRAKTFIGELKGVNPVDVEIPVVGGHSGVTIIPLLSQVKPSLSFTQEEVEALTHRIQFGGDEVVQAKAGTGSATLSMAYAAMAFVQSLMSALSGTPNIITPAYVLGGAAGDLPSPVPYFSSNITLGSQGVSEIHPLGECNAYEQSLLDACIPELTKNIEKGVGFVASKNA